MNLKKVQTLVPQLAILVEPKGNFLESFVPKFTRSPLGLLSLLDQFGLF